MVARTTRKIDETDRKLLSLLRDNARMPVVALARGIGLSRSATQERLGRLEDSGVIAGYSVQLGQDADQHHETAYLMVRTATPRCEQLVPILRQWPEVVRCDSIAGEIDLIVEVHAENTAAIQTLRDRVADLQGVAEVRTAVVALRRFERL